MARRKRDEDRAEQPGQVEQCVIPGCYGLSVLEDDGLHLRCSNHHRYAPGWTPPDDYPAYVSQQQDQNSESD